MASKKDSLALMAAIVAMSRGKVTLAQWRENARKDLEEITREHSGPAVAKAAEFANKVADMVLDTFPHDYELCGMKQTELDNMLHAIGAGIEITFRKLAEPTADNAS